MLHVLAEATLLPARLFFRYSVTMLPQAGLFLPGVFLADPGPVLTAVGELCRMVIPDALLVLDRPKDALRVNVDALDFEVSTVLDRLRVDPWRRFGNPLLSDWLLSFGSS
jgi:hypothetical protein